MKKTIAVLFAVMMMLLSAVPAFAAVSPEPSTFKYKVEVIPTEGGDGDYKFTTGPVATATAKKDDSTTSPKTGASDVVPYAILVLSLAACGAAVFKLVKSK